MASGDAIEVGSDDTLAATEDGTPRSAPAAPSGVLTRGTVVGRYLVLSVLGEGGMGVVHAAHDPELDRRVALKLVRPGVGDPDGSARARLLREAQAMAQLADPNVVAIHDVGVHEGAVWIAMEHVSGTTLDAWLAARPRGWGEVLDVMIAVGRGLSAAHHAGLLHRDLKPDNIMVGDDGRVRVMDLGLARVSKSEPKPAQLGADTSIGALASPLTQAGALLGTPRYMAPEQLAGTEVTAAADQFAFCLTLWEALFGERPFHGETFGELAANVIDGRLHGPSDRSRAPAWLRRLCARGLAADPTQRFASMDALLAAITLAQARARRGRIALAVAALATIALAAAGIGRYERARVVAQCHAAGEQIAEVWNDDARARVRTGLDATGLAYATATAVKIMPYLDDYATAWTEARTEACLDAHVRERWDDDRSDRALWCLRERELGLAALLDQLADADADALPQAITAAAGLAPIAPCRDEEHLLALPPPPDDREAVGGVLRSLARAAALDAAGRYERALATAEEAEQSAAPLGWPPMHAAALLRTGSALEHLGRWEPARARLEDAYFTAAFSGEQEVAADAAMLLARVVGFHFARRDEGLLWGRLADVALTTMHEPEDSPRRAVALDHVAHVHWAAGEYQRARELNERGLEIRERALGPDHPELARSLDYLANAHAKTGDPEGAIALHERALAIRERALGPDHPDVASSMANFGDVLVDAGHPERARALLEDALRLRQRTLGPEHPGVAGALLALARVDAVLHDTARARDEYTRALAILEQTLGDEHPSLANALVGLAEVALAEERPQDAIAFGERALRLGERVDAAPRALAHRRFTLARALWDTDRARALLLARLAAQAEHDGGDPTEAAAIDAWLATHAGP